MESFELRQKFLDFFKKNGHAIIPSASLIPQNDPTVLFTTAGMHPLVPFLLGEKHPSGKRLTSAQKCIRTGDIDDVGDDTHNTFFEMLGNWSLGDYWKKEAMKFSFEFLTKQLNIPLERMAFTCFAGDNDAPKDEESAKIWGALSVKKERIAFLPKEDNWWGPAGQTGPCGPDTEMFYWKLNDVPAPEKFDPKDKNWVEIWNDVFMQYVKDENGKYLPAKQKNVDTGMGLERTLAVLNGKENIYETDLFLPIIKKMENISGKNYSENKKAFRIIADHSKASAFLLAAGIEPSNLGRGYILRRLIRRAIRYSKPLGLKGNFISEIYPAVAGIYNGFYPEIENKKDFILEQFKLEEEKFEKTLEKGLKNFEKLKNVSGKDAFDLYQSYGFPIEITQELAKEKGIEVDIEEFKKELEKHQELSRTASAGMFKGGLADASSETTRLHTAAHLMLAALRKVLGQEVLQKGSNITAERLRFDFSYGQKMTPEQIKQVEELVNRAILDKLVVEWKEEDINNARAEGAMGVFGEKYGDKVKVYTVSNPETGEIFSKEICGGPHVKNTSELGKFKIVKEESSSAGVRRIKAVLE